MEPLKLKTASKQFRYGNLTRKIDSINDVEVLREMLRTHIKINLKYEEMLREMTDTIRMYYN